MSAQQQAPPPQQAPPQQYGPPPQQYPGYMHPVPKQESGIAGIFSPTIVLLGIAIGALLIFIGYIVATFLHGEVGAILGMLGEGGGLVSSFGGAFFGKEFSRDQRLGLYILAAAFMIGFAFP